MNSKKCGLLVILWVGFGMLFFHHPGYGAEGTWKFVVMGDTRDKITATMTGISPDLAGMAEAIAAEKPDLVIHTGDLVNGYYTTKDSPVHGRYVEMFRNWKAAMRPVYDYETGKGVPIYPVRGNHEDGKVITDPELKAAYVREFGLLLPQNGPAHEKGLTYRITYQGAEFFALDEYARARDVVLRGYVNQKWLDEQFARSTKPFLFVYCHTPAYRVGNYHQSPFPNLYSHPKSRNALWKSFKRAGVSAYFCGHIHFYSRGTIDDIPQVVIGNGGADTVAFDARNVEKRVKIQYPLVPYLSAADVPTGYVVITVDEKNGTASGVQKILNAAKGVWEQGDTFTLKGRKNRR